MIRERDRVYARNIARLLAETGLKQRELAKKAGVDTIHLNRILKFKRKPGDDFLNRISIALGVSVADLERDEGDRITVKVKEPEQVYNPKTEIEKLTEEIRFLRKELQKSLNTAAVQDMHLRERQELQKRVEELEAENQDLLAQLRRFEKIYAYLKKLPERGIAYVESLLLDDESRFEKLRLEAREKDSLREARQFLHRKSQGQK